MLTFGAAINGYQDVEDQMIDNLRRRAEACFRAREAERDAVTDRAAFEAYRAKMRESFLRAYGGLPEERGELNARVTGTIDRGAFRIEKLIYESVPNFPVTAAVYVPAGRTARGPAVLFVCGHAEEAKGAPRYQQVCADLAGDGFLVLAMDPPGQGERFQFIDETTGEQRIRWGTREHTYAGMPFYAMGASIARQFTWDAIRAIDYLVGRPEVDPEKIGVTGNSGGGTQTVFLMMLEPRLAAAMPCTFVMDYESYMKTGQGQDAEQNLAGSFLRGPDHDDYLAAMAPRPVRVGLAAYDFFPIEGALKTIARARKVFALFGAEDKLDYALAMTTHQYSDVLRQAAVNFFRKHLRGDPEDFRTENPEPLPPEALHATETGQVLTGLPGCKTVSDLAREELARRVPAAPRQLDTAALARVLGATGDRTRTIYPRIISDQVVEGYRTERIYFFTEPEVCATAVYVHPRDEQAARGTEILLLEEGTDAIPREKPRLLDLLESGRRVFVFDPRGVGAVKSRASPRINEAKLGCDAMKLDLSTAGLRTFDVLRGYDYLATRDDAGEIHLTGVGAAGAWALYAAALEQGIAGVTVEEHLYSYRDACATRYYDDGRFNFKVFAWGLLEVADLRDIAAGIAPRPVCFVRPLTPQGVPAAADEVRAYMSAAGRNIEVV